jgi:hypothetical protein
VVVTTAWVGPTAVVVVAAGTVDVVGEVVVVEVEEVVVVRNGSVTIGGPPSSTPAHEVSVASATARDHARTVAAFIAGSSTRNVPRRLI